MKFKRAMAALLSATMVLGTGITAFATSDPAGYQANENGYNATGTGTIEYDNSSEVVIDQITVPTVSDTAYNFQLDPMLIMKKNDSATYNSAAALYFAVKKAAIIDTSEAYFYSEYTAKDNYAADITVTDGEITAVTGDIYVYVPDTDENKEGLGKHIPVTAENASDYFIVKEGAATVRTGSLVALEDADDSTKGVFDGKVYGKTYTAFDATKEYALADYKDNVYVEDEVTSGKYNAVAETDIKTVTPDTTYGNQSEVATLINKSTKNKTVKATVTLSNTTGINIVQSETLSGNEASMYMVATDTANEKVFLKANDEGTQASAIFKLNIAAPDVDDMLTYRTNVVNANTGSHNYAKYAPVGMEDKYNSGNFAIVAGINSSDTNVDLIESWKDYSKTIESADDRLKVDVVYEINDADYAPKLTDKDSVVLKVKADGENSLSGGVSTEDYVISADLGGGTLAATKLASVSSPLSAKAASFVTYDATAGTITIAKSLVNAMMGASGDNAKLTFTLANDNNTVKYEYVVYFATV